MTAVYYTDQRGSNPIYGPDQGALILGPSAGAITLTGYAPTVVQASAFLNLTPNSGQIAITGYAPTVAQTLFPPTPSPRMTQPLDIITSALGSIGAWAPGEPLDAALAADAFLMLNDMLDMWSNDDFMVISINEVSATIAGATDWTIGPSGQIVNQRPLAINSAFVRVAAIDYPVQILNVEQYELIGLKQLNGPWPRALWYNSGTPNGLIKFWPLPSSGEIHLFCSLLFSRFATINDIVQLPQGYAMAMRWSLALLMMPGYGKTDATLVKMVKDNARQAIASVKGTNMLPQQTVQFDAALSGGGGKNAAWIYSGGFR